jgi:S-adenosylmethionine synthetase
MSKIKKEHIFTSESVSEGHPDKVSDQISDAILDACLKQDSESRVACETLTTTDLIVISGELTTTAHVDFDQVARQTVSEIGYTNKNIGFSADACKVFVCLHKQSADISQGVSEGEGLYLEQGAGDQGMMFGYATDETPELMPAPVLYSHKLVARLAELRKNQPETYNFLLPDAKSQVSINYDNGVPESVHSIVVSHQHTEAMKRDQLETLVRKISIEIIPENLMSDEVKYYVNPTGRFVIGGPHGDTGLTGRKIIVDTYGGVGSHGGGAFSGKDPSKVDRSAAYMCRYVAKNIVAAGLAGKCEVQAAYAIGVAKPVSINIDTYGTGKMEEGRLHDLVTSGSIFDMRPAGIIRSLGLKNPYDNGWNYLQTAAYGHFGRDVFPWEKTDKIDELRDAMKV